MYQGYQLLCATVQQRGVHVRMGQVMRTEIEELQQLPGRACRLEIGMIRVQPYEPNSYLESRLNNIYSTRTKAFTPVLFSGPKTRKGALFVGTTKFF